MRLRTLALLALALVATLAVASSAAAAPAVSADRDVAGFPTWYQDAAGNRVEPCVDPNDANCVLPPIVPPLSFPANYPDEFFYTLADSEILSTPGCAGTAPGKASVRLALEGAFINGAPTPGDQMTFGRIRVKVTSGLCPDTVYKFRHPFGIATFTTNGAGAVPANVGTVDIGCVPTATVACNFSSALSSPLFGSVPGGGFLRWDAGAPAGYLGDGVTPHTITGGSQPANDFEILDSAGASLAPALQTNLFQVSGKLAGSLTGPSIVDFAGQVVPTTSAPRTITIKNVDSATVTVGTPTSDTADFAVTGGTCTGAVLNRDQSCTVILTFTPAAGGPVSGNLTIASTGGVRSPLTIPLAGFGSLGANAPQLSPNPNSLAFGGVRVRTASAAKTVTISNPGASPLVIDDIRIDTAPGDEPNASSYRIATNTCTTGASIAPAGSCTVSVVFAPLVGHATALPVFLSLASNATALPVQVAITGTGTGGVAAVSPTIDATDGFPDWYMAEDGAKVSQCIDPNDPNCIVLADPTYDPGQPLVFPTNFPGEFFYQVATSDNAETPGCLTDAIASNDGPGKAFVRSAIEGTFVNGVPVDTEQMLFGRIRIAAIGGLCANTEYTFVHPYGADKFTTNAAGNLTRVVGTDDTGCVPVAPATCDFSEALSSRVFGGLVRWDPAIAPAAPAGYLGDAATLHEISGAPFSEDGVVPANYFKILDADGNVVAETNLFTVMGKLRGPLEVANNAAPTELGVTSLEFDPAAVGASTSAQLLLQNTGIASITLGASSVAPAGEFSVTGGCASGTVLAVGDSCVLTLSFSPTAVGDRTAVLTVGHSGLNTPIEVTLTGVGTEPGANAAISFSPASVDFPQLAVGRTSVIRRITVSNVGGGAPLSISAIGFVGAGAASYQVVDPGTCLSTNVDPGATCAVDIAFTPQLAGANNATLAFTSNAFGVAAHVDSVTLTGTGSPVGAGPAVSATNDGANGFPHWFSDANGVRLGQCINAADPNCIVLADAGFNPGLPMAFPTNFPAEFFYSIADSDIVSTPGCVAPAVAPGTIFIRIALEGSFANGTPAAGDQITFARVRVTASGLCPNQAYVIETPYGILPASITTTDATGGIKRAAGTIDVDPAAGGLISQGFLRWDPAVAPAAPAGYLGDARSFHRVVGGTYTRPGDLNPLNGFVVNLPGGGELKTDKFIVSGKLVDPLVTSSGPVNLGVVSQGAQGTLANGGTPATVVVINPRTVNGTIAELAITGAQSEGFVINPAPAQPADCQVGTALASDATCNVRLRFDPLATTTIGAKAATLRVSTGSGAPLLVSVSGTVRAPVIAQATFSANSLAFSTAQPVNVRSATQTLTVTNTGSAPLNASAALVGTNAGNYVMVSDTCTGTPVAANGTCTVRVAFQPLSAGSKPASLVITHNAAGSPKTIALTGTGVNSGFTLNQTALGFSQVNVNSTKTLTLSVRNSGTIPFTLASLGVTGPNAIMFTTNGGGCVGVTLQPGKSCNVTVSFRPTSVGAKSATLRVTGDVSASPAFRDIPLTGSGK